MQVWVLQRIEFGEGEQLLGIYATAADAEADFRDAVGSLPPGGLGSIDPDQGLSVVTDTDEIRLQPWPVQRALGA